METTHFFNSYFKYHSGFGLFNSTSNSSMGEVEGEEWLRVDQEWQDGNLLFNNSRKLSNFVNKRSNKKMYVLPIMCVCECLCIYMFVCECLCMSLSDFFVYDIVGSELFNQ